MQVHAHVNIIIAVALSFVGRFDVLYSIESDYTVEE